MRKNKSARTSAPGHSRRDFLYTSLLAGSSVLLVSGLSTGSRAAQAADEPPDGDQPLLLRAGVVLTMDEQLGDFERADVLIEDGRIADVAPVIESDGAREVDARGMIIMPGFVDTHRHMWQGQIRNSLPNGTLQDYVEKIIGEARPHYRPEDVHIGDLLSALAALNAGITTVLDWSHIGNSPAHTDAAILGLQEAGVRAVYAYGAGSAGPDNAYPEDLRRLRREHFSSPDQLLTLALASGSDPREWALAREVGAPITSHINGSGTLLPLADQMGEDNTYIHCTQLTGEEFDLIAGTGGGVSIAGPVEMEMGHGEPPYQQVIDRGIPWSLSNDVETEVPADFFTQMQHAFTVQRMNIFSRRRNGEDGAPPLITAREVLRVATLGGARVNHLDQKIGSLTPGKEADLIMLDMNRINVMPVNNAYGAVVLGMDSSNIRNVLVRGRPRKWQGRLLDVDMQRISRLALDSRDFVVRQAGWEQGVL